MQVLSAAVPHGAKVTNLVPRDGLSARDEHIGGLQGRSERGTGYKRDQMQ